MKLNSKDILHSQNGFTLIEVIIAITMLSILMSTMYTIVNNSTETTTDKPDTTSQQHMDTTSIIGLVIWFLCLLYSSVRTASSSQAASKYDIFFMLVYH